MLDADVSREHRVCRARVGYVAGKSLDNLTLDSVTRGCRSGSDYGQPLARLANQE